MLHPGEPLKLASDARRCQGTGEVRTTHRSQDISPRIEVVEKRDHPSEARRHLRQLLNDLDRRLPERCLLAGWIENGDLTSVLARSQPSER